LNELIDELLSDAGERMAKSVESTRNVLATVRTGRASPHLLDRIVVDYYGTETPLNQLSNVAAADARLLTVTPYDKGALSAIEKAINSRLPRVTVPDFDYHARPETRLEIPIAQRIAEIRARKAEERARAKAKLERRAAAERAPGGGAPRPGGSPAGGHAHGRPGGHRRPGGGGPWRGGSSGGGGRRSR